MARAYLTAVVLLVLACSAACAAEPEKQNPSKAPPPAVVAAPSPIATPNPVPGGPPPRVRDPKTREAGLRQFAETLVKQYDKNTSGVLEKDEWGRIPSMLREADRNGDGVITVDELSARLMERGPRVPDRPGWRGPPAPPPVSIPSPGMGRTPISGRATADMPRMSPGPLDPRAPTVGLRVLVAELAADAPGSKSPPPGTAPAGSAPGGKLEGPVDLDLSASSETLKEALGKMGLRGRWESFRNLQLCAADGQVAYAQVGLSEPTITGFAMSLYGRTNSIQYQQTGFIVGVQPHVDPGGIVTVNVDFNASRLGSDEEGVPIAVLEKADTIASRPIHKMLSQSIVRVPDGKTVLIAKVSRDVGARRRELIVFLSAQVVKGKGN